nr:deoxyribose-phosphate aldolase [uncultured Flavobacterium sp.]
MKKMKEYIDATYLKTAKQAQLTEAENDQIVKDLLAEAMTHQYKCVMLLPEHVSVAKNYFIKHKSKIAVGTVINFPEGTADVSDKLKQAQIAIDQGADELDFVINYPAFKAGNITMVQEEVLQCTQYCLNQHKTIKWIIETAALTDNEIIRITTLIKNTVMRYFKEIDYQKVFVKSSTGFFSVNDGTTNGATPHAITLMLENAGPLPIKASGGIKTVTDVLFYLQMGVKRIGTSAQKQIIESVGS